METELKVLMDKLDLQARRQDEMRTQLDLDRSQLDQNTIDIGSIKKGQEAILNQMTDFKSEIRQTVLETIKEEVPKAVKRAVAKELNTMMIENPRKVIVRHLGVLEWLRSIFLKKS